jgi:hypothetical protein
MRGRDDAVSQGKALYMYIGMSDVPAWWVAQANALAQLRGWLSFILWFGTACGRSLGRRARSDKHLNLSYPLSAGGERVPEGRVRGVATSEIKATSAGGTRAPARDQPLSARSRPPAAPSFRGRDGDETPGVI